MFQCYFCKTTVPVGTMKCKICGSRVFESVGPLEEEITVLPPARDLTVDRLIPEKLFSSAHWEEDYLLLRDRDDTLCLILTNTTDVKDTSAFDRALKSYIYARRSLGISYCVLDLADQRVVDEKPYDCADTVSLLQTVYDVAEPDYLLILGDHDAVPSQIWRNDGDSCDTNILSDLPYITLDADSPWSGVEFDFTYAIPVGRVPTAARNDFAEAVTYLNNMADRKAPASYKAFTYTAASWEATSRKAFAFTKPRVEVSPPNTIAKELSIRPGFKLFEQIDDSYDLLCFNLHGGSGDNMWVGESYPDSRNNTFQLPAFKPEYFPRSRNGFVVCSEACYGANPIIAKRGDPSALLYALTNGCIGFVGSTRVAWGGCNGYMSCADVLASNFSSAVAVGATLGESYLFSLQSLVEGEDGPDEKEIKTMAEFGLYGDPTEALVNADSKGKKDAKKTGKKSKKSWKRVTKKDPSRAVSLINCTMDVILMSSLPTVKKQEVLMKAERVNLSCQNFIKMNCADVKGVEPKIFKVMGRPGYRAYVHKMSGQDWGGMSLHYDDDCNLKMVCYTK